MSAGAESARSTTARHQAAQLPPPRVGSCVVVEGIEDPVALADVEIGLLRRHGPNPALISPGEKPALAQAPDGGAIGGSRKQA